MRRRKLVIVNGSLGALAIILIILALMSGGAPKTEASDHCKVKSPAAHTITIKNDSASPAVTHGRLCDTLTITNDDHVEREIAFGPHEDHVPYDGVAERLLGQGESLTITFDKPGAYHWHDHLHDDVQGNFIVQQ